MGHHRSRPPPATPPRALPPVSPGRRGSVTHAKPPCPLGPVLSTSTHYHTISLLGKGAFGKVYLAQRVADNVKVAIKRVDLTQSPKDGRRASEQLIDKLQSWLHMFQALSANPHRNIVDYYDR
ncbi:hypothetical protein KIPB_012045 [Kipferlia bialata]|uniref:Protein kinase domain-containing protein n=1 Tax=Kipferlia bialata TaxID=797122 RepID=A0A9K3GP94_9EUKA|nr:hypothetical protein KIPB_012045 [Kipferlia bialata]|eukprot:g12045.t1